jgi:hypothetical protein
MNWKLASLTLLDRVRCLVTLGIFDEDDSIGTVPKQLKDLPSVSEIVGKSKSCIEPICMKVLMSNIYFEHDHVMLALAIVGYLRKVSGLLNVWSTRLQRMTDVGASQIS